MKTPLASLSDHARPGATKTRAETRRQEILLKTSTSQGVGLNGAATIQVLQRINPEVRIITASRIDSDRNAGRAARTGAPFLHSPHPDPT
jgi:hypothetical protein